MAVWRGAQANWQALSSGRNRDVLVVLGVVLIVMMMVIPLPPALLDLLLATNITLALLILMLTMNVTEPLQFSVFPSLLLVTTLFRLALNVSSTRLILLSGYAGSIIQAFGQFVVGGNTIVGLVVFLILVVIQFVVITRGAERVAEVAARFTLDAMPGKQMSIDADLNAGLINEREARTRRREIEREADFYGAMDGASKFVKGDAIAGIVITLIDILGGLAVGMLQRGLELGEAVSRYTLLTVGDGLVSQIPALLISTATGIIVTRAASESNMGEDLSQQLLTQPKVLAIAAGVLGALAVVPGLPTLPFLALGGLFGGLAYQVRRQAQRKADQEQRRLLDKEREEAGRPENVMGMLAVDVLELEIGYGLIPLVDQNQGGELLDRITMIRRQIALELGLVVPPIRIRDNMQLKPNAYSIHLKGIEVGRGEIMPNHFLAMDPGTASQKVKGIPTTEPTFGLPALWIAPEDREQAEMAGYTVVDPPSVLATHLTEVIRSHAHELLGRQETKQLLDSLKAEHSAVVEELVPDLLTVGEVQKVLQHLLRESVSIRNLVVILETLADRARETRDPAVLTEWVREALARQITHMYAPNGYLAALTLDPEVEDRLREAAEANGRGPALDPAYASKLVEALARAQERAAAQGEQPVVLVAPPVRRALRQLTERVFPRLAVLAYTEVAPDAQIRSFGTVSVPNAG